MYTTDGYKVIQLAGPGSVSLCAETVLGHFCIVDSTDLFSLACHKDTLYIMTKASNLYQVILNNPGSCRFLTNFAMPGEEAPEMISLVSDKNGILYMVDDNTNLYYRYDPHNNTYSVLGVGPSPNGDLIYYNDTLLSSANGPYLYAVNLADPAASTVFMPTGNYSFWGLLEAPGDCSRNKFYGIDGGSGTLVEFDPASKSILGTVCGNSPPLDGASTLEDGTVAGLSVDSLVLEPACVGNGSIKVAASNGAGDTTSYTLDGVTTDSTGIFPNIPNGIHSVHIQSSSGCTKDTTFNLEPVVPVISIEITNPPNCTLATGIITIIPADPTYPYLYSLNGTPPRSTPDFYLLDAGLYTLSINYGYGCQTDTGITLRYQNIIPLPGSITITPANCTQDNGSIVFTPANDNYPQIVSTALNSGSTQTVFSFSGLIAGSDTLHLNSNNGCHYDSVLYISQILNPEPSIAATVTNQECVADNGSIGLTVSGLDGPYTSSINNSSYTANLQYNALAPMTYKLSIEDRDACLWDTSIIVQAYPKDSVTISVDTVNPVCTTLNSGSLKVSVDGDQAPYSIGYAGSNYPSGTPIGGLNYGNYSLAVTNKDGCLIDSVHTTLTLDVTPGCSIISVPNAFSPNGDGHNDVFRVIHSPYQAGIRLKVYDRLGAMVFSSSGQNEGWDGTFRGKPQPAGTYVWLVEYMDWDKQEKSVKGIVILLR
jgi:gliding motility-associated-like protein